MVSKCVFLTLAKIYAKRTTVDNTESIVSADTSWYQGPFLLGMYKFLVQISVIIMIH